MESVIDPGSSRASRLLVSAVFDDDGCTNCGAAWVLNLVGTSSSSSTIEVRPTSALPLATNASINATQPSSLAVIGPSYVYAANASAWQMQPVTAGGDTATGAYEWMARGTFTAMSGEYLMSSA